MKGKEHMNFQANDEKLGPAIISIKDVTSEDGLKMTHMILRLSIGTFQQYLQVEEADEPEKIAESACRLCPGLSIELCSPIISRQASDVLASFDQNNQHKLFKFGVLLQKKGQITETDIYSNSHVEEHFEKFLAFLGKKVDISKHKKYKGGLENIKDNKDIYAIHQRYMDCEIIFHVGPFLPDSKRREFISKDVVTIVFQEDDTPFHPDIIQSQFLHAFIVIRPNEKNEYKISIVTKQDVPEFGPDFQNEGCYPRKNSFKQLLMAKLINAQNACHKSRKFKESEQRKRSSLLSELSNTLSEDTDKYLQPIVITRRGRSMDESTLSFSEQKNLRALSVKKKRSQSLWPTLLQTDIEKKDMFKGAIKHNTNEIKLKAQQRRAQRLAGYRDNSSFSGSLDSIDEIVTNFAELSMDNTDDTNAVEEGEQKNNNQKTTRAQMYKKNEKRSLFRILKTKTMSNIK